MSESIQLQLLLKASQKAFFKLCNLIFSTNQFRFKPLIFVVSLSAIPKVTIDLPTLQYRSFAYLKLEIGASHSCTVHIRERMQ